MIKGFAVQRQTRVFSDVGKVVKEQRTIQGKGINEGAKEQRQRDGHNQTATVAQDACR
jgi:hypothetical protein